MSGRSQIRVYAYRNGIFRRIPLYSDKSSMNLLAKTKWSLNNGDIFIVTLSMNIYCHLPKQICFNCSILTCKHCNIQNIKILIKIFYAYFCDLEIKAIIAVDYKLLTLSSAWLNTFASSRQQMESQLSFLDLYQFC